MKRPDQLLLLMLLLVSASCKTQRMAMQTKELQTELSQKPHPQPLKDPDSGVEIECYGTDHLQKQVAHPVHPFRNQTINSYNGREVK